MDQRIVFFNHEVRASKDAGKMKISGYAARYNSLSGDLGGFKERIQPGAFNRILATKPDCVLLFNHDSGKVLGRTTAGTLQLRSDDKGLAFDCDLPNTTHGRDTYESIQRGDIAGCSFAFTVGEPVEAYYSVRQEDDLDAEDQLDDDYDLGLIRGCKQAAPRKQVLVRTLRDFDRLLDVSVVTNPAYVSTSVSARNQQLLVAELRSRVEKARKPIRRSDKPCFEDRIVTRDNRIVARRKHLLAHLLS